MDSAPSIAFSAGCARQIFFFRQRKFAGRQARTGTLGSRPAIQSGYGYSHPRACAARRRIPAVLRIARVARRQIWPPCGETFAWEEPPHAPGRIERRLGQTVKPLPVSAARPEMQTQRPSYSLPMRAAGQWRSAFVRCFGAFLSPDGRAYLGVSESMSAAVASFCAQPVILPCGFWIFCPLPPRGRSEHVCIVKAVIDPPAARHIRAKPLVRADETFPLTAISYNSRVFNDVFGPCFPCAAIHQQGRCLLLRDLRSPPRTHLVIPPSPYDHWIFCPLLPQPGTSGRNSWCGRMGLSP